MIQVEKRDEQRIHIDTEKCGILQFYSVKSMFLKIMVGLNTRKIRIEIILLEPLTYIACYLTVRSVSI